MKDHSGRPRIQIEKEAIDVWVELLGLLALVAMFAYPAYYYPELADEIPQHYGADGKPDSYGSKSMVWLLPIIGLVLYAGLWYLNRLPHLFNYTTAITEENAERQYRLATRMMRCVNTFIAITFAYISYSIVRGGLDDETSLGLWFIPVMIVGPIAILIIYIAHASKG